MGYRSDVRIVTSREGFEKLKEFVKNYLKEDSKEYNLLEECDIKREGREQCYFGWNYIKWYENSDYKNVDSIMEGLNYLEKNEYSYRYMRIGEDLEDYDEQYYNSERENEPILEYPTMIREFDDQYVLDLIQEMNNDTNENYKEEIDF